MGLREEIEAKTRSQPKHSPLWEQIKNDRTIFRLWGIMGFTGLIGGVTALHFIFGRFRKKRQEIRKSSYYQGANNILKSNNAAMKLIGPPVQFRHVNIQDPYNILREFTLKLKWEFLGTLKKGTIYVWAARDGLKEDWNIDKIELTFADIKDQKVIIYKNKNESEKKETKKEEQQPKKEEIVEMSKENIEITSKLERNIISGI